MNDPRGLVRLRTNLKELADAARRGRRSAGSRGRSSQSTTRTRPKQKLDALALRTHFVDAKGASRRCSIRRLVELLEPFDLDDVLIPQWPLFKALGHAPMLLMRSQFTEQLRRTTFEEMLTLRRDTEGYEIEVQGSPALLDSADDVRPIADFVRDLAKWRGALREPARRPRGGPSVRRFAGISARACSTQRSRVTLAPERELVLDPDHRAPVPGRDLVVVEDAEVVEPALDAGADAVDHLEVVAAARARRGEAGRLAVGGVTGQRRGSGGRLERRRAAGPAGPVRAAGPAAARAAPSRRTDAAAEARRRR